MRVLPGTVVAHVYERASEGTGCAPGRQVAEDALAAVVFWGAVVLGAYTLIGYLLLLVAWDAVVSLRSAAHYLAGEVHRRVPRPTVEWPRVSVLIAAHNEVSCIRQKIENTLALDYPADKLEVLVGSDGSTDGTDEIVREYAGRRVQLSPAMRYGKASVLNRLARMAAGELWLFTDANTTIQPDALRSLATRIRAPEVGAVCGRLRLVPRGGGVPHEGLYWQYENLLKLYESRHGAVMGANGGLYLLRASEWRPLPQDTIVDDFRVTMRTVLRGRQVTYAPDAVAFEETAVDVAGELARHVRISAGNFQSLGELWPLLGRRSFAGFAFWSHKVLRWCLPLFLMAALVASATLAAQPFYAVALLIQLALYGLVFARRTGWVPQVTGLNSILYFMEINAAIAMGFARFVRGSQPATWARTRRAA